jgi:hypothetical protein
MSYEGYTQVLCSNGHLRQFDCNDYSWSPSTRYNEQEPLKCSCGASFVWSHEVDQTNDEGVPAKLEVAIPEEWMQCDMGHKHIIKEGTYHIPVVGNESQWNKDEELSKKEKEEYIEQDNN